MHRFHSNAKKSSGTWQGRLAFVAMGIFLMSYGLEQLHRHIFVYSNWLRQPIFSAGLIATGSFSLVLACLPSGNWFYRRITTKRTTLDEELRQSHLAHPSRRSRRNPDGPADRLSD
jgi:hypothetical protein